MALISICVNEVDSRYVTRASRDQVRHITRKMERTYGHGLVGLIHPVTGEFNHAAVIEQRGGRFEHEVIGNTEDFGINYAVLQGAHYSKKMRHLLGQEAADDERPKKMDTITGKTFDRYDAVSFLYGAIIALQDTSTKAAANAANKCFLSSFETITQVDYAVADLETVFNTGRYFNVLVYDPIKIWNNLAAAYEYCNGYLYVSQLALLLQLDYGFLSELTTRWSIIIAEESDGFFNKLTELLFGTEDDPVEHPDFYLVGFQCGIMWQLAFDVKL